MSGRSTGLVLAVALVLAGCGRAPAAKPAATPSAPASSSTADANGSLVPDNLNPSAVPTGASTSTSPPKTTQSPTTPGAKVYGADLGWPQCPKGMGIPEKRSHGAPLPTAAARFWIVGLTNGPSFVANPCLADQVRLLRERHLLGAAYAVLSYPSAATLAQYGARGPFPGTTQAAALKNTGYAAAQFDVASMKRVGLRTPFVWIDVEPVPKFAWSDDTAANAAVVLGAARGFTDAGFRVGFYSTPSLWARVVGDLRTGAPEWRAAGQTSEEEALSRCGPDWSIQGGTAVLGQWVEAGRDRNVTCPGSDPDLSGFFARY
ncbi:MAG: hypothetical protein ACJ72D_01045 [Marmoricola sp.]